MRPISDGEAAGGGALLLVVGTWAGIIVGSEVGSCLDGRSSETEGPAFPETRVLLEGAFRAIDGGGGENGFCEVVLGSKAETGSTH